MPPAIVDLTPVVVLLSVLVSGTVPSATLGQTPSGRDVIEALEFEPLDFDQPRPERHDVAGVTVLMLEDRALPLVTVYARFRGGYGRFQREWYGPAIGLPAMLRYGGTTALPPDSVDVLLEQYAIQMSFGTGGGSISSSINVLTEHVETSVELWAEMLGDPGFDEAQIEIWRGRELERLRRRADDPAALAFAEFNRLLYGDHPIGWEVEPADLSPRRVSPERFHEVHARIVCRDNLILGVTGDVSWTEAEPLVEVLVDRLPECRGPLPDPPIPDIRSEPGIFLIERDLEQAVVVMAHPTSVRLEATDTYFAATMGNAILGGGGLSSRLLGRVRTEEGYAYSASSLWTTPRRYDGLVGALTRTRPETALAAVEVILATMRELRERPPTERELRTAVDGVVNGFVFNFQTPGQIVSRMMYYLAGGLPEDWLERYAQGVQQVTPEAIRQVFADHLRPEEMTILIVGDPDGIGRQALANFGPVTVLDVD